MSDGPNANETNDIRQMREALNRKDERIKALEGEVSTFRGAALSGLAHQAGYDPKAGPVKLVMEKFEADLTADRLDPDAFTTFAKEWGVEPKPADGAAAQTPGTPTPQQQQQPQLGADGQPITTPDPNAQQQLQQTQQTAQQVQQLQTPADQLAAAALANQSNLNPDPHNTAAQIAAAQTEGRWADSFALKIAQAPSAPDGVGVGHTGANPQTNLPTHTPAQ